MATYPTLSQSYESDRQRLDGILTDEGGDGSLWVRQSYPTDKYAFTVIHIVDATQKATLEAFYSTNKALQFDLVFRDDMTAYTGCVFVKSPQYKLISRRQWRATVQIRQQ